MKSEQVEGHELEEGLLAVQICCIVVLEVVEHVDHTDAAALQELFVPYPRASHFREGWTNFPWHHPSSG